MSDEDFTRLLEVVIDEEYNPASSILQVPGVYELLAEHHNNDVLSLWAEEQEEKNAQNDR